jgi:LCP family protein required for cell wall assembly
MPETKTKAARPQDAGKEEPTSPGWWPWIRTPVLVFSAVIAALVSLTAVWGLNLYLTVAGEQKVIHVEGTSDPWDFGELPRNVLVLGSDSRKGLTQEQQAAFGTEETVEGQRSDTIILMSIDPRREQAVVVHFPRDLRVEIPGHGFEKINAAYEYGGPELVIKTVREFTGIPIHNYIEIDLAGFQDLVDSLGGVRICVPGPMDDDFADLHIPKAGCYDMDGATALAFVRARHVVGDTIPDFSRIRRQQQFMRATFNQLISFGNLLDDELIRKAVGSVRTDDSLTPTELLDLGRRLRALAEEDPSGAESLDLRVVPGIPQTIDGVSYVVAEQPETRELFQALEDGKDLKKLGVELSQTDLAPGQISIRVLTTFGTGPEGAEMLMREAGFIVLGSRVYSSREEDSEILYKPGARPSAEVVHGYFPELSVREVTSAELGGAEVGLIVGEDWEKVT